MVCPSQSTQAWQVSLGVVQEAFQAFMVPAFSALLMMINLLQDTQPALHTAYVSSLTLEPQEQLRNRSKGLER